MLVFGGTRGEPEGDAAGDGEAAGEGDADGDADGDGPSEPAGDGPAAGPCASSRSAPATTVDVARPAIIRLAAANLAAVGIPPIAIEGTGAKRLNHKLLSKASHAARIAERVLVGLQVVPRDLTVHPPLQ